MNYVEIRDTIITALNTAWVADQTAPIFYENTVEIDLDTVGGLFVACEIDFTDTVQADLGPSASSIIMGELMIRIFSKDGTGTRAGLALFDYATTQFQRKNISDVVMETATPGRKVSKNGWTSMEIFIPFSHHSIS
jgi:hypothetical protein